MYCPRLFATVLLASRLPFSTAGPHLLFESAFAVNFGFASSWPLEVLSAAQWLPLLSFEGARLLPLRRHPVSTGFVDSSPPRRPFDFFPGFFFVGGAASTSSPRLVSTRFVDRRIPFVSAARVRSAFRASARASVRGARLLPPPRFESTASCRLFFFPLSAPPGCCCPPAGPSRGRGFYHRRVVSQLRPADSVFRSFSSSGVPTAVAASPSRSRGRGMYRPSTVPEGSQLASSTPYFVFPSSRCSHRQRGFASPVRGGAASTTAAS